MELIQIFYLLLMLSSQQVCLAILVWG